MKSDEARRLREKESESGRLKKLPAETELDKAMLQELTSRHWQTVHSGVNGEASAADVQCQ